MVSMPCFDRISGFPTPDSSRICGVWYEPADGEVNTRQVGYMQPYAPAQRTTSRRTPWISSLFPSCTNSTPTARCSPLSSLSNRIYISAMSVCERLACAEPRFPWSRTPRAGQAGSRGPGSVRGTPTRRASAWRSRRRWTAWPSSRRRSCRSPLSQSDRPRTRSGQDVRRLGSGVSPGTAARRRTWRARPPCAGRTTSAGGLAGVRAQWLVLSTVRGVRTFVSVVRWIRARGVFRRVCCGERMGLERLALGWGHNT